MTAALAFKGRSLEARLSIFAAALLGDAADSTAEPQPQAIRRPLRYTFLFGLRLNRRAMQALDSATCAAFDPLSMD
jgi:hypothetical protein